MSEYEMLRQEIIEKQKYIVGYKTSLYSVSAVLFAFVWDKNNFLLSLIPLVIIVPLFLLSERENRAICKLSAYMYVFLEGEEHNWERRYRVLDKYTYNSFRGKRYKWIRMRPYYTLVLLSCGMALFKLIGQEKTVLLTIVLSIVIVLVGAICFNIMKKSVVVHPIVRDNYIKQWYRLKYGFINQRVKDYDGNRTRTQGTGTP